MNSKLDKIAVKFALGCIIPILIVIAWQLYAQNAKTDSLVPKPYAVWNVLMHPFEAPDGFQCKPVGYCAFLSILRMLCGFFLAAITGIMVGVALGVSKTFSAMFAPVTSACMAISPLAWIPLAIAFIGTATPATWFAGDANAHEYGVLDSLPFASILIISAGAFFPIALSTAQGINQVRTSHIEIAKSFGATGWQITSKVVLPSALPSIFTGLRLGAGVAWRVILAAEMFPGTTGGLGYLIQTSQDDIQYAYAFAGVFMIAFVGIVFDGIMKLIQWKFTGWCKTAN